MTGRPPLIPEKKKRKTKTYMQRYQEFGSGRKFVKKKEFGQELDIWGEKQKQKGSQFMGSHNDGHDIKLGAERSTCSYSHTGWPKL